MKQVRRILILMLLTVMVTGAMDACAQMLESEFDRVTGFEQPKSPEFDDGGGIELVPPDLQDDQKYSLEIDGRLQTRYTYFDDQGPFANPSVNEFELERVRLNFGGFIYEKYLTYSIGTDWDTDGENAGGLTKAFVQWDLEKALGIGWGNRMRLRLGLWRSNFGRQQGESSKRLQFVDRAMTSAAFRLGRNVGLGLIGRFSHNLRPVDYEIALLNGFGVARNEPRSGLDNNLGISFRIAESIVGDYGSGEPDLLLSGAPSMRVGFSAAYTHRTRRGTTGSEDEFDESPAILFVTDIDSGSAFFRADDLNGPEREYDLTLLGVEADWKRCGWSLHSEYLFRWMSGFEFESGDDFRDFSHGFYVQGGYFVTEKVELVGRHSALFAQGRGTGSPIGADYDVSAHATGGGINFYFRQHASKLQMDAFYYDGAPFNSSALNLIAGDRGTMLRMQYQLVF